MAPPRRFESPHEQLVSLLVEARCEGLAFEAAWDRAIRPGKRMVMTNTRGAPYGALLWPTDSSDRIAWKAAIVESRDAFRRAYERRPATLRERSVVVLLGVLDAPPARPRLASVA